MSMHKIHDKIYDDGYTFINFTYEQENSGDLVHKRAVRARLEEYFERKRLKDEEDEFDWNNTKF